MAFIDAAARAGVGHLVYTSFLGAAPAATFTLARDHWATEEHLRAVLASHGLRHTILRDNLYADALPFMVGADGVIRGPAGQGRLAAVARDDVADVAAAVLLAPAGHAGRTYQLTGPQALTLGEVAATITEVTGRAVSYVDETVEEAYASRASYHAPDWQVDAWVSTYTAIAAGEMSLVSTDVQAVTGHPATSLATLLAATARRPPLTAVQALLRACGKRLLRRCRNNGLADSAWHPRARPGPRRTDDDDRDRDHHLPAAAPPSPGPGRARPG